jgi:hypothetical protein
LTIVLEPCAKIWLSAADLLCLCGSKGKTMKLHARTFAHRLLGASLSATVVAAPLLIASNPSYAAPRDGSRGPGRPGGSTSPSTTTSNSPSSSAERDIKLLEGALAATFSDAQKAAITTAATTREAALRTAESAFKSTVAATFGLTSAELDAKIKAVRGDKNRDLATTLAAALGRVLTDAEKSALSAATRSRDAAFAAANNTYRITVAVVLETTVADLDAKVKAYLDAQKGEKGKGGKGQKSGKDGGCEKDTTTGGTDDTSTTDTGGSGGYS